MNTRIRELAIEAGMIVGEANGFDMTQLMPRETKFAELIVKECVDIVEHSRIEGDEGVCLVGATKLKIEQHFGVEE